MISLQIAKEKIISAFSLLYHILAYKIARPFLKLENGTLIISVDVDVGNRVLGEINNGKNDRNVHTYLSEYAVGMIEELSVPLLIDLFENLEIPVTFALRGQLLNVESSVVRRLVKSPVEFDIGAHGYSHKEFARLSPLEAEMELKMIAGGMKKFGTTPKSFVFPKNSVDHLDLLEKYGYFCFRGRGGFIRDGAYVAKVGKLYDVHPSLFINKSLDVRLLKKILDISIEKKLLLHIWFHPKDLGYDRKTMKDSTQKVFSPFFEYAKKKEENGLLTFETMLSAVEKKRSIS